jgi:prevent-host-death family protein
MTMLEISEETQTLDDFQHSATEVIEHLAETGRPLLLTVNGEAKVVVQDAAAYQRLRESAEQLELLAGLERSLESMRQGKGRPAREFFAELRKKHNLPSREA